MTVQQSQDSAIQETEISSSLEGTMTNTKTQTNVIVNAELHASSVTIDVNKTSSNHTYSVAPTPTISNAHCMKISDVFVSPLVGDINNNQSVYIDVTSNISNTVIHGRRHVTPMPHVKEDKDLVKTPTSTHVDHVFHCIAVSDVNTTTTNNESTLMSSSIVNEDAEKAIEKTKKIRAANISNKAYKTSIYFPVIVHRMIDEVGAKYGSSLMRWHKNGDMFWIDQTYPTLGEILKKKYFKHDHYQSLRRQLNAYGFRKFSSGEYKGYWKHPSFCRDSTYDDILKTCAPESRGKKRKAMLAASSSGDNMKVSVSNVSEALNNEEIVKSTSGVDVVQVPTSTKTTVVDECIGSPTSKKKIVVKKLSAPKLKSIKRKSRKVKFRKKPSRQKVFANTARCNEQQSSRKKGYVDMVQRNVHQESRKKGYVDMVRKSEHPAHEDDFLDLFPSSTADFELLPMDDIYISDFLPTFYQNESPSPTVDDSVTHALSALATVASCLPNAPPALFSPINDGDSDMIFVPSPLKGVACLNHIDEPKAIKMTISSDVATTFYPTPIKLPVSSLTDFNQGQYSFSQNDCFMDDVYSTYSIGSLSSPFKLLLPTGDRSAFTPVVTNTSHIG